MKPLPTATVTFLFTDIEGSTKLWEQYPDAMQAALVRHDALVRSAIEDGGGTVFKTIGDAFCAVFPTAATALAAAVAGQSLLQHEAWPGGVTLPVRMAVHTGAAQAHDDDYFGPALNRVARLLVAGYGGQVLVSAASYELARDGLPEGIDLRDLGLHRLKDLDRPEQVFQVTSADLPTDFPPLRSQDYTPNNLPQPLTSFIGRETEMRDVRSQLVTARLLTLTGPGGNGKTRLALQAATDVLDAYPDGVWLVELAPLSSPTQVVQAVASVLGIKEQTGQSLSPFLVESLKPRRILLLLDNCEHLITACAQLIATVLRSCPKVQVLATSHQALGISGEQVYRVPSLSLPDPRQIAAATQQTLSQFEATRLFIERARLVKPDFLITDQNAPVLAQICQRVDGIPLALELAAARVRSLSIEDINTRLDSRFRLLTGGDRSALPRQQTLRALVDWSYDLLNLPEKVLLYRLSVFSGGWTLAQAEAIGGWPPLEALDVFDVLTSLVDKSLVLAEANDGTTRYRMLETLRQYAAEKKEEAGEETTILARHRDWFVALAEEAEPELSGPAQAAWLTRVEAEHDNLRAALASCWSATGDADKEAGVRLVASLEHFWWVRGYLVERWENLRQAMRYTGSRTVAAAKVLTAAGDLAAMQGDNGEAQSLHEKSLAISREGADLRGIADSLDRLGNVACRRGDFARASGLLEESFTLRKASGDRPGIARSLESRANLAYAEGDLPSARALREQSLALKREQRDKQGMAMSLYQIGNIDAAQADPESARLRYEESLALFRGLGDKYGIANSLKILGITAYSHGDLQTALSQYTESLAIRQELGDTHGIALALQELAGAVLASSDTQNAARLAGAAHALLGNRAPLTQEQTNDAPLKYAQLALGDESVAAAWEQGCGLLWQQALSLALGTPSDIQIV